MSVVSPSVTPAAIHGVQIVPLVMHADERGTFTEIFRESWVPSPRFIQWNAVKSRAGTLRGVHVHLRHSDYLVLVSGHMWLGLVDLRSASPTRGQRAMIEIVASQPMSIAIPTGVAHGFLFPEDSFHVYAVSEYYDITDELGCRWDDPELQLRWPVTPTMVSPRDRDLPALRDLRPLLPF